MNQTRTGNLSNEEEKHEVLIVQRAAGARRRGRVLGLGGSAAYAGTPSWCGPKKATIALLDGFGGNSWRLITTASAKEEAAEVPEHHGLSIRRRARQYAKGDLGHQEHGRRGIDALVVFRRRRSGGAAGADQRLSRPARSSFRIASKSAAKRARTTPSSSALRSRTTA